MTPADLAVARVNRDLLLAEQDLRARAEQQLRAYRDLARHLAARFGGEALDALLRADPQAAERMTAEAWRAFFDEQIKAGGWGSLEGVQAQLERAERDRDRLRSQLAALEAAGPAREPRPRDRRASAAPGAAPASESKAAQRNAQITQSYVPLSWPEVPARPAGWESLRLSDEMWPLAALQLWLIAAQGWPLLLEGARLLGKRHAADANRARKVEADLAADGLIHVRKFAKLIPRDDGETTSANAAVLTDRGKSLCRQLWAEPVKTELDLFREARLDERAQAGGLLFAHAARLRGCAAAARPDGKGALEPDLALGLDDARTLAVLEMGDDAPASLERWRGLAERQGFVALCAASPSRRAKLAEAARAAGLSGRAADLQTLNAQLEPGPLWAEEWG